MLAVNRTDKLKDITIFFSSLTYALHDLCPVVVILRTLHLVLGSVGVGQILDVAAVDQAVLQDGLKGGVAIAVRHTHTDALLVRTNGFKHLKIKER